MMKEERKQELMEYAKVLATLKSAGLNYAQETNQVIKELNELMKFNSNVIEKYKRNISNDCNKNGKIVTLSGIDDRGVGKTESLVVDSSINNIPIIVKNEHSKKYINEMATHLKFTPTVFTINEAIIGMRFPNGVLVDECVGLDGINSLLSRNIVIRGGYLSNSIFI